MSRYLSSFVFSISFCVAFSLKNIHVSQTPRITLTAKELIYKRLLLPEQRQDELLKCHEENTVYVGGRQLLKADFHARQIEKIPVFEKACDTQLSSDCQYNITMLYSNEETDQLLICRGTYGDDGMCCHKNLTMHSSGCTPAEHLLHLQPYYQEREPSLLIVTPDAEELYTTRSGTEGSVGIYRFGKTKTTPKDSHTELRYLSLVTSGPREEPLQDKLYAFYMEKKNSDPNPDSELWIPRVAQICMADVGGPKGNLQYSWTSQLRARLLCGDQTSKQYFSQLVDTATLKAERWQDTRVYGLFRNTWGVSAVCVYTMEAIDSVFKASNFKGYEGAIPSPRPGICSQDSTKLSHDFVKLVSEHNEMVDWVMPTGNTTPLLVHHHNYTHILGDRVQTRDSRHTVLFLSTEKGVIHKVLEKDDKAFVIAEYQPFSRRTHILNMMIHSSEGKLYVSSSSELVQVDLGSCALYGPKCEDCFLARDPYCVWNGTDCTPARGMSDVTHGDTTICKTPQPEPVYKGQPSSPATDVKIDSKHFLICPISSNHAQYSWYRNDEPLPCLITERECLLLIESMSSRTAGTYRCESEEGDYRRILAQYTLQVEGGTPGLASCHLGWIIVIVTVVQMLMC